MKNGKKLKGVLLKKKVLLIVFGVIGLTLLYNMTDISSIRRTINILKSFNEGIILDESTPINSDNDLEIKKTINGCTTTTIKASLLGNSGINTLSIGVDSANLFVKGLVSPKEKLSNPNCAPCPAGGTNPSQPTPGQPDPVGPQNPGKDDSEPVLPPDDDDSEPVLPPDDDDSEPVLPPDETEVACESGITDKSLAGKHGVAMNAKAIYDTSELKNVTGNANPGIKFEILGENGKLWAINYEGKCGWVDSTYMAINGVEYLPDIRFNITNASASIYRSSGKDIAGLTGVRLYNSSEYNNSFVPITYSFAKKLKIASANARAGGDTLVVYDAYRPSSVTALAKSRLDAAMSDSEIKEGIMYSYGASGTKYSWGKSWFLAQGKSAHNNACAVDITLSGQEGTMPSAMHELSTRAIKYYSPTAPRTSKGFSTGMLNSSAAQKLNNYMMSGTGLTDLASEWWHYQLNAGCYDTVAAADFWS